MRTVQKTICGVEYTAVWRGMAYAKEALARCRIGGGNVVSDYKLAEIVFGEIIIRPQTGMDDFADLAEFYEVLDFGAAVLLGTYWDKPKAALKRDVEEDWSLWRLVCNDLSSFRYEEVFYEMTPEEIAKANIALDLAVEQINRRIKTRVR